MKTFGEHLKEARKERKITQRELGKMIGVDFTYISKIETGALEPPSEEVIKKISKVLDLDENELFLAAKKVPTEFKNTIMENSTAKMFFRKYPNLTDKQLKKIEEIIEEDNI